MDFGIRSDERPRYDMSLFCAPFDLKRLDENTNFNIDANQEVVLNKGENLEIEK